MIATWLNKSDLNVMRLVKTAAMVGLAGYGLWMLLQKTVMLVSSDAVLTAPIVSLRAPIDGVVEHDIRLPGRIVPANQVAVSINNRWIDTQRLDELEVLAGISHKNLESLGALVDGLKAARSDFSRDSRSYRKRRLTQLELRLQEAEARLEAESARLKESTEHRLRQESLGAQHIVSEQEVTQAVRDETVAQKNVLAAQKVVEAIQASILSGEQGVIIDGSASTEKPYAGQKLDEVNLMLIQRHHDLNEQSTHHASLKDELQRERDRVARLGHADLAAPARSRVWKISAWPQEFVQKGAELMQLIDCSNLKVTVNVSERNFHRIRIGAKASFRPTGSTQWYDGEVVQRMGAVPSQEKSGEAVMASVLDTSPGARTFRVIVNLAHGGQGLGEACEIGLTGDVKFEKLKE